MESLEKVFHTFLAFPGMRETQTFLAHIPQRPGK